MKIVFLFFGVNIIEDRFLLNRTQTIYIYMREREREGGGGVICLIYSMFILPLRQIGIY